MVMHAAQNHSSAQSAAFCPQLALVTETWPPEINGVAMTLSRLASGLRESGWGVRVVRPRQRHEADASRDADSLLVPGLPIPGYSGLRFGLPVVTRLRREWQKQRPDIVHIATEGPLGWAALQAAENLGIPVTSTFHTNFHRYCKHYRIGWLRGVVTRHLRQFHNRAALTMVPNAVLGQQLELEGYRHVVTLGRGVDTHLFNPRRRSSALRAAWGVPEPGLAILYVGRLAPEKNLRVVEAAFKKIEEVYPSARMIWVGDGPELERLRKAYPAHVLAGAKQGEELASYYASADLFLFPSQTETYGNVVPEALASGVPVVAYDYAAASMLIKHGQHGLLAPLGDRDGFVSLAASLGEQPQRLDAMRLVAHEAVSAYSWETVIRQFDGYLRHARQGKTDKFLPQ
jgi:glycosyltransferase involved in cell wall biosynthesis